MPTLTLYIQQANFEKLRRKAEAHGKTSGGIINQLVEKHLSNEEFCNVIAAPRQTPPAKHCVDCAYFRGNLSPADHEFLEYMLKRYSARLMVESWVKLGQTKKPAGRSIDSDKAKAVQILKRKGFCMKERVHIYALEENCVFWQPREKELPS